MARKLLKLDEIRSVNYSIFHDLLGIIPTIRSEADRNAYQLKDLQYAPISSDPDRPKWLAAKTLKKVYHESGVAIEDVSDLLINPDD